MSHAYPPGALIRVADICTRPGRPGLLPIAERTWHKWVKDGRVPAGKLIGARTRVWPVEQVLKLADEQQKKSE